MVLHLLPKKSWNVYNTDNIERVRRDEARAREEEEREERRIQEADKERRVQKLRASSGQAAGAGHATPNQAEEALEEHAAAENDGLVDKVEAATKQAPLHRHLNLVEPSAQARKARENENEQKARLLAAEDSVDLRLDKSRREPTPWYNFRDSREDVRKHSFKSERETMEDRMRRTEKDMDRMDPLSSIKSTLQKRQAFHDSQTAAAPQDSRQSKVHRSHHESSRRRKRPSDDSCRTSSRRHAPKSSKTELSVVERLRVEQQEREREERNRRR